MLINFFICSVSETSERYRVFYMRELPGNINREKLVPFKLYPNSTDDSETCYIDNNDKVVLDLNEEVDHLKKIFSKRCYDFSPNDYWYYEFCPFKHLKQYRFSDSAIKIDFFMLGSHSDDDMYVQVGDGVQTSWKNGDICTVDNRPRRVKVVYECDESSNADGFVASVTELEFCSYLLKFYTEHVCHILPVSKRETIDVYCIV